MKSCFFEKLIQLTDSVSNPFSENCNAQGIGGNGRGRVVLCNSTDWFHLKTLPPASPANQMIC
jgi:hypothetical protein